MTEVMLKIGKLFTVPGSEPVIENSLRMNRTCVCEADGC